jgi:hypothetical protein
MKEGIMNTPTFNQLMEAVANSTDIRIVEKALGNIDQNFGLDSSPRLRERKARLLLAMTTDSRADLVLVNTQKRRDRAVVRNIKLN